MLSKFSRIVLIIITVFVLSVILPDYYWKIFESKISVTRVYYSPILKNFLFIKFDKNAVVREDIAGNEYSVKEFESLTPFRSYRQLMVDGNFPDSIQNIPIDAQEVRKNNITMFIRPSMIDIPQIQLFPLFESQSGRVRLEMPADNFRITDKIEFIDCATNEIDKEKSREFNEALVAENFRFPPKYISGNVSAMKPFDEGYFIVDSGNDIYHLKQVKGKPYCKKTGIDPNLDVVHITVQENELKEFYGILITRNSEVYFISYDNYKLIKVPADGYDFQNITFYLNCNLFYRTISLTGDNSLNVLVTDRNYKVIDKYQEFFESKFQSSAGRIFDYIFPFSLSLVSDNSPYIDFYFRSPFSFDSLIGILISFILVLALLQFKHINFTVSWYDFVIVLVSGIFGLIAVVAIRNDK